MGFVPSSRQVCYSKSEFFLPMTELSMSLQEKLLRLFELEQKVRGLQARSQSAAARLKAQQARLKQLQQQRTELAAQLKTHQVKAATLEHQMQDWEKRIAKLRDQMNSVTSNKEYAALLVEVNTLKADKSKVEEQALEAMTKVDGLRKDVEGVESKITDQTKIVGVTENELKAAEQAVAGELNPLIAERDQASQDLPAAARTVFNRQLDIHEGEPMAQVIEESRKHMEYSCGGCFLAIPVERVNALMVRDEIVPCTNCGRILYIAKELRESFSGD